MVLILYRRHRKKKKVTLRVVSVLLRLQGNTNCDASRGIFLLPYHHGPSSMQIPQPFKVDGQIRSMMDHCPPCWNCCYGEASGRWTARQGDRVQRPEMAEI